MMTEGDSPVRRLYWSAVPRCSCWSLSESRRLCRSCTETDRDNLQPQHLFLHSTSTGEVDAGGWVPLSRGLQGWSSPRLHTLGESGQSCAILQGKAPIIDSIKVIILYFIWTAVLCSSSSS
jgi:hypothetical protein